MAFLPMIHLFIVDVGPNLWRNGTTGFYGDANFYGESASARREKLVASNFQDVVKWR